MKIITKNQNLSNEVPVLIARFTSWFGDDDGEEVTDIKARLEIKDNPRILKLFKGLCHFIEFGGNHYGDHAKFDEYFANLDYVGMDADDDEYSPYGFGTLSELLGSKFELSAMYQAQINEFLRREGYISGDDEEYFDDDYEKFHTYMNKYDSVPYSGYFELSGVSCEFFVRNEEGVEHECEIVHILEEEKVYTFTIEMGDPSNDGHGQYESVSYESPFKIEDIEAAYTRACEKLKVKFNTNQRIFDADSLLCEFEDNVLYTSVLERLISEGLDYTPLEYLHNDVDDDDYEDYYTMDLDDAQSLLFSVIRTELPGFFPNEIPTRKNDTHHILMGAAFFYGVFTDY